MTKSLNDFIQVKRQKNGRVKITHNISNKHNIYRFLKELGFCISRINKKRIYYQRIGDKIRIVSIFDIEDTFKSFIETTDFIDMPSDISRDEILDWFYEKQPIKQNDLLLYYLLDSLTSEEEHELRLKTDIEYKKKFEITQLQEMFKTWKFNKTVDKIGAFCSGNDLYYKHIGDNKYLVFNHYNPNMLMQSGFDSWIATFTSEKNIGNKRPINIKQIKLSFHLDKDYKLIKNFVE